MSEYYYLVASLPMLEFGNMKPFSCGDFLIRCREHLNTIDMATLERVSIAPQEDPDDPSPTLREWKTFEVTLRNDLARARAAKKGKDPAPYIRKEESPDPFMAGFAHWLTEQEDPLEVERSFDKFRWERIEEIKKGHYFDIVHLITYALQLQIIERWEMLNSKGGMEVLQELVTKETA